jgi:predicted anti-sigma-YlaC factor YlaD
MRCVEVREVLSAGLDGEDEAQAAAAAGHHVQTCAACAAWLDGAAAVTRRVRLGIPAAPPDLTARVTAAVAAGGALARPRVGFARLALAGVALLQIALSIPALLSESHAGSTVHLSREIGATDIALAIGVLAAAWRPWRAAGMLPVVAALALGLSATTLVDVTRGHVPATHELPHLLALADAALLWLLRRRAGLITAPPVAPVGLRKAA